MRNIINNIASKDRAMGWIILQINDCSENGKWYPAIASLFMVLEQVLRFVTNSEGYDNLDSVIKKAKNDGIINGHEEAILHDVRRYRNMYIHSNFHENMFEVDGLLYPVNDEETAEVVFKKIWNPCLNIIHKLAS